MTDPEKSALAKLEDIGESEFVIFTHDEAEALREVALWWKRLKGTVALGGALGNVLKWAVIIAAGIAAIKAGLVEWLLDGGQK